MTNVAKFKFIQNLTEIMHIKNITQAELARRMGIGRSSVNAWLKGRHCVPRTEHWGEIARCLGVNVRDLLKDINVEEML